MASIQRSGWHGVVGTVLLVAALVLSVGSAQAAFPGRDGLLAVQPVGGRGIVLVKANGRGERRICADRSNECTLSGWSPARPHWSSDGRSIALDESPHKASSPIVQSAPVVIYPDGSCLNCAFGYNSSPVDVSFTDDPTLFTAVSQVVCTGCGTSSDRLTEYGIDGIAQKVLLSGSMSDPVWSSGGKLAVVRGGLIWVGDPASLRRLARGNDPSWSPGGSKIVFERSGWLLVRNLEATAARRLVRGSAPAWSSDGRWIAFFDREHRLSVVRASGGHVRHVGGVTGRTVDWQPIPATPSPRCSVPPSATVAASGNAGTVTFDFNFEPELTYGDGFSWAAMGCLYADGRHRLLARPEGFIPSLSSSPTGAVVAGHYAAMVMTRTCGRYFESNWSASVELFDLRTGTDVPARGGESASGELYTGQPLVCDNDINVVLGSDAVSATHSTVHETSPCTCTLEQIQASDRTGVRTLDAVTESEGSPAALTNLTLTGDTLTWEHNGTARSVQLQP